MSARERLRIEEGTVGALRLEVRGRAYSEDVRATRCVAIEGSGSRYLVGVEFLQTGRADEASIRRAMLERVERSRAGIVDNVGDNLRREDVMREVLRKLVRSDDGQDLIEYGLLVGIITVGAIVAIQLIGPKVKGYFDDLNAAMP